MKADQTTINLYLVNTLNNKGITRYQGCTVVEKSKCKQKANITLVNKPTGVRLSLKYVISNTLIRVQKGRIFPIVPIVL